jgi:hypothetical protein
MDDIKSWRDVAPMDEKRLSTRLRQCLHNDGIRTMGEVLKLSDQHLRRIPNFGTVSLKELRDFVRDAEAGKAPPGAEDRAALERSVAAVAMKQTKEVIRALVAELRAIRPPATRPLGADEVMRAKDDRIDGLLVANNYEVERRRFAEWKLREARAALVEARNVAGDAAIMQRAKGTESDNMEAKESERLEALVDAAIKLVDKPFKAPLS